MPDDGSGPEPGPRFHWAGSVLDFTPSGELGSLRRPTPAEAAEPPWLCGGGSVSARSGDAAVVWAAPELAVDVDELEVTHQAPSVVAVVRHAFGPAWGVRLALRNPSVATVRLDELRLGWTAPPDRPSWALAAGAAAAYGVFGAGGRVLGGVLTRGEVVAVTPDGFELGAVVLPPGARYVVQWEWRWWGSARAFAAHRRRQRADRHLPSSLVRPLGDAALVTVSADEALVLAPGLVQQPLADQMELSAPAPGTFPVEVRSIAGATRYDLRWAPPVRTVLLAAAASALDGRRNVAGVVVLSDVAAALVVQAALRLGCDDPDSAEEALDLFTARVRDRTGSDPWRATFLCGEYDRTGDVDLVEAATAVVGRATAFRPGLGLAAGHLALARMIAGQRPAGVPGLHLEPEAGPAPVERAVAELEVALVGATPALRPALARLGTWLGAGLTGSSVRPLSLPARAWATAVLAAVPDDVARDAQRSWAGPAVALGRWTEAAVLADLPVAPAGPAHAWLAVAARTG